MKSVYVILYNYSEKDYSIIKIKKSLKEAYGHVCNQERDFKEFRLIEISKYGIIPSKFNDNMLKVCYINHEDYHLHSVCDNGEVSNYVIVKMSL